MLEDGSVFTVDHVDLTYSSEPHDYHKLYAEHGLAEWDAAIAQKPSMFNGNVLLEAGLYRDGNSLKGSSHSIPFSSFIHWIKNNGQEGYHLFAMGLMISEDGFPILGRMADNTFNAGKVYGPSGSLDEGDIINGQIDLNANIIREIGEETGLESELQSLTGPFDIFVFDRKVVAVKRIVFSQSAGVLCQTINDFIQNDKDAELSEVFAIREPGRYEQKMAFHMPKILNWFFALST
jgi:8-oxo-dGTP pyrophosphatase MutT (NUDIX family)